MFLHLLFWISATKSTFYIVSIVCHPHSFPFPMTECVCAEGGGLALHKNRPTLYFCSAKKAPKRSVTTGSLPGTDEEPPCHVNRADLNFNLHLKMPTIKGTDIKLKNDAHSQGLIEKLKLKMTIFLRKITYGIKSTTQEDHSQNIKFWSMNRWI